MMSPNRTNCFSPNRATAGFAFSPRAGSATCFKDLQDKYDAEGRAGTAVSTGTELTEAACEIEFPDVKILFTSQQDGGKFKWVDSGLQGLLRVFYLVHPDLVDHYLIPPIVHLKLWNPMNESIFEFELPLNFQFEPKLTSTFAAIHVDDNNWVGFVFTDEKHRKNFHNLIGGRQKVL